MGLRCRAGGRSHLFAIVALGWPLVVGAVVAAPVKDIFTVSGVAVDTEAETAAVARELALADGQRQAYRRLLERLTLRTDYGRHPVLEEAALTALVQGIEVEEEKRSATRYLARLTISFKKDEVRRLLRDRGLEFSETIAKPILLLPVYEVAGVQLLWDDPNPWRDAWMQAEGRDSLVPLMVPAGDLTDIGAISPAQALAGDLDRLRVIAARYGVEDTIVARAVLTFDLTAGAPRLEVSLGQQGPSGEQVIIESFVGESRELIDELLARAAGAITIALEETWKRDTLLRFDRETRLSAAVPLGDLAEWLAVRRRLGAVAMVRRVEISSLSVANAQVVLHYLGDPGQLSISLAQHDLELAEEEGFWILRLRRPAAPGSPSTSTSAVAE